MKPGTTKIDVTEIEGSDGIVDKIKGRLDHRIKNTDEIGGRIYFKLELSASGAYDMIISLHEQGPFLFYQDIPSFCSLDIHGRRLFKWMAEHAEDIIVSAEPLRFVC